MLRGTSWPRSTPRCPPARRPPASLRSATACGCRAPCCRGNIASRPGSIPPPAARPSSTRRDTSGWNSAPSPPRRPACRPSPATKLDSSWRRAPPAWLRLRSLRPGTRPSVRPLAGRPGPGHAPRSSIHAGEDLLASTGLPLDSPGFVTTAFDLPDTATLNGLMLAVLDGSERLPVHGAWGLPVAETITLLPPQAGERYVMLGDVVLTGIDAHLDPATGCRARLDSTDPGPNRPGHELQARGGD